jgi:hypothetical protein
MNNALRVSVGASKICSFLHYCRQHVVNAKIHGEQLHTTNRCAVLWLVTVFERSFNISTVTTLPLWRRPQTDILLPCGDERESRFTRVGQRRLSCLLLIKQCQSHLTQTCECSHCDCRFHQTAYHKYQLISAVRTSAQVPLH